jgi:hypothetical protein
VVLAQIGLGVERDQLPSAIVSDHVSLDQDFFPVGGLHTRNDAEKRGARHPASFFDG